MCKFYKFYICAVVGIIIEWLNNMHGVTMKIKKKIDSHVCYIVLVQDNDRFCSVLCYLFVCFFVCSVMVCVCDPEHSARTLHIPGLHLHQESLPWLACAAGDAAWQAAVTKPKVGSQHCWHLNMRNGDSGVSQCDVHIVRLPEVFV